MTISPTTSPPPEWVRIAGVLQGVACGLTSNAAEREDLVQETLLTLLARAPDKLGHMGYARSVLVRTWLDRQRSLRRRMRRMALLAVSGARHHVDTRALEEEEQRRAAARAIEALPPRQRAAIVLRLIEGLGYEQIAEVMGCDVATARANLHLARSSVRRAVGGDA